MNKIAFALLATAACMPTWDVPDAAVRAKAPPGLEALWQAEVEQTIQLWAVAVEPYGCTPPFRIAERWEEAYPIRLILKSEWEHPGFGGKCFYDEIQVLMWWNRAETLAHELGHAMGLEHHNMTKGLSILDEVNERRGITEKDAMAAACMMGCGPCDTIDDYNQGL